MRFAPLILVFGLILALPLRAQDAPDPNVPLVAVINFDTPVEESITSAAIFDRWLITLNTGDEIVVEMQAANGLSPLIGILNASQDLQARSDETRPPEPNGLAVVQYRAETSGEYIIVATREDNQQGTTIGTYTLVVRKVNTAPDGDNTLTPVELRCHDMVWKVAVSIEFAEETPPPETVTAGTVTELYRLTVFGIDDFQPVIQADASVSENRLDCSRDAGALPGSSYTLPGAAPVTIAESDLAHHAQLTLRNSSVEQRFGAVKFTIGSLDGTPGRYLAVLEGLALQSRQDVDEVLIRLAPLAKETPLTVYMVGENATRLDPSIEVYSLNGDLITGCDDAGRGDCAAVLSFTGAGVTLANEALTITGDRFDAGVVLSPGNTDPLHLRLRSRDSATAGTYTLFIIGELP